MDVQYEFDLISLSPVNYVRNDHEEINSGIADNEGQIYNETENLCISSNGHDFRIFFFFLWFTSWGIIFKWKNELFKEGHNIEMAINLFEENIVKNHVSIFVFKKNLFWNMKQYDMSTLDGTK